MFKAIRLTVLCPHMQALARLAPLLRVDAYREAVLEGMVACIGGLDGHLSKEASAALVQQSRGADAHSAGEMLGMFIADSKRSSTSHKEASAALVQQSQSADAHSAGETLGMFIDRPKKKEYVC